MGSWTAEYTAAIATIIALPVGFIAAAFGIAAVFYAGRQLGLARKAGSAASLIALNEAFRQNWHLFISAGDEEGRRQYTFADLVNALEIACAVFRDGVFYGHSKGVLERYLVQVFTLIEANANARARLDNLLQSRETFENIREFLKSHKSERQITRAVILDHQSVKPSK